MASSWGNDGALSRRPLKAPRKRHPNVPGFPRRGESVTEAVKRAAAGRGSVTRPSICQRGRRGSVTETEIRRRRGCITSPKRRSQQRAGQEPSPKRKSPPAAGPQPSPKRGSRLHGGKKRYRNVDAAHGDDGKRHRSADVVRCNNGNRHRNEDPGAGIWKSVTETTMFARAPTRAHAAPVRMVLAWFRAVAGFRAFRISGLQVRVSVEAIAH